MSKGKASVSDVTASAYDNTNMPNSLEEFWMPFTPQKWFKSNPRIMTGAEGMYYTDQHGKSILDGCAGLWCVNAGHKQPKIVNAIKKQAEELDFISNFQQGTTMSFKAASKLVNAFPDPISHVFFCNSGSESVDTALKIALAYHRMRGEGTRQVLIGRERAYHGVGFGGISVGGIPYNRAMFGSMLPKVDHMRHTHDLERNRFAKGEPEHGAELADDLERLIQLHEPENVAAVIVEPVSGSTGVLPPPKGYLKRLREIADKYGVLLIFDEVVTGFGRMGKICASEYFGVMPDIICTAKGLTNASVPMGAVFTRKGIYEAFDDGSEYGFGLMHGYTYSGHPLAAAAAMATLECYLDDGIFDNAAKMMPKWEEAVHSLQGKPYIEDIRNSGIIAGIEVTKSDGDDYGARARDVFVKCFEKGLLVRYTGNNIALSPPLILDENHLDQIVTTISEVMQEL
jgi:beta-alanine--pyruvate transaminase